METLEISLKIIRLPGFQRDLKSLSRKYKSLEDDLIRFINTSLKYFHELKKEPIEIFQIPGLSIEYPKIYKARRFSCTYMKGTGGHSRFRVIYAYFEQENKIELIEIYFKGDKKNEDKDRLKAYCKQFSAK